MRSEIGFEQDVEVRALLEEQYNHPRQVDVEGTSLEIYDLYPESLKTEVPTIVVPGVGGTAEMMKENLIGLAEKGRRVIVGSAAHGLPTKRTGPEPSVQYRKGETLIRTLKELELDQVDVVGHSEASMILRVAMPEEEYRIRNLVLVNGAGLNGPDTPIELSKRTALEMGRATAEELRRLAIDEQSGRLPDRTKRAANVLRVTMKSLAANPQSIWSSIVGGGTVDTTELLRELRSKGHRIALIHGAEDAMLPMKTIQPNIRPDMVDGFYSVRGGHNELFNDPEKFNVLIDQALDALEAKGAE